MPSNKYAIRKILLKNAVTASKNANGQTFSNYSTSIIPFFHSRKHKAPLKEATPDDCHQQDETVHEENLLLTH
jgi:hypothetical protein